MDWTMIKLSILTAIFAALVMLSGANKDVCNPNPCQNQGKCKANTTTNTFLMCVCMHPSKGKMCEIANGMHTNWLLSLAFSLPISVLLLVGVAVMYVLRSRRRKEKFDNQLEVDYNTPPITTSTHASPLDTVTTEPSNPDASTQL